MRVPGLALLRDERPAVPQLALVSVLGLALVIAFSPSYRVLLPLAGSDSPIGVVLIAPLVALAILFVKLPRAPRNSEEILANVALALPFLFALGFLLIWAPARYSDLFREYRLDLLAVPAFAGVLLMLGYGLPALWETRGALLLLAAGWPPVADKLAGVFAQPLADLDAAVVHAAMHPFFPDIRRVGDSMFFGHDGQLNSVQIAGTCSGLAGVMAIALLGVGVLTLVEGPGRRKRLWFASAIGLVLVMNVVRLVAVVAVAHEAGIGAAATTFHQTAGPIVAAVVCFGMLLLLRPFGLRLVLPRLRGAEDATLARGTAIVLACATLVLTVGVAVATAGLSFRDIGLYTGVQEISAADPLPAPARFRTTHVGDVPGVAATFGGGAIAKIYFMRGSRGEGFFAQVVVTRSHAAAAAYGVLQCFTFHQAKVYDAREAALPEGGTTQLIDVHVGKDDIATSSWLQPVLLGRQRAWRRTILYQYLPGGHAGEAPQAHAGLIRRFGLWLVNRLSPYGGVRAPHRFERPERDVLAWTSAYTTSRRLPSLTTPGAQPVSQHG